MKKIIIVLLSMTIMFSNALENPFAVAPNYKYLPAEFQKAGKASDCFKLNALFFCLQQLAVSGNPLEKANKFFYHVLQIEKNIYQQIAEFAEKNKLSPEDTLVLINVAILMEEAIVA